MLHVNNVSSSYSSLTICGFQSLPGFLIHVSGLLPALRGPLRASAFLGFLIITIALLAHDLLVFRFFLVQCICGLPLHLLISSASVHSFCSSPVHLLISSFLCICELLMQFFL